MRRYKWSLFGFILFFGTAATVDVILKNYFLKKIIDLINLNISSRESIEPILLKYVFLSAFSLILGYGLSRLGSWSANYFQNKTMRDLSNYIFVKITSQSHDFFTDNFSGSLVAKIKRFIQGYKFIIHSLITSVWPAFLIFIFSFGVILFFAPIIAYVLIIWLILYIFIISFFIKRKIPYDLEKAKMDSKVGGRLADVFTNILNLKVFSTFNFENKNFEILTKEEAKHRGYSWFLGNQQRAIKALFMVALQIVVLYLEINLWVDNEISSGTIVLIQSYIIVIFGRMWDIDETMTYVVEFYADMKETSEILNKKPNILDPEKPEKLNVKDGEIKFENVSFEYVDGVDVFKNFNLHIKKGEKVGLVGHSGSGKSTITKMLLRFLDVKEGSITLDGQNIKNITQDDLRSVISYVPQEPILFHRSIFENISYSKDGATKEEVEEASKNAHAHEFISGLQHGYDTLVGERGVKLSGGERQRVAIARAMLKDAPILVLDEATSSLDSISESYIQEAFVKLMEGRTTIVIAHRLSTIQKMDRILVLDKGEIIEQGTHKELLEKRGQYAKLWESQTGGFLQD